MNATLRTLLVGPAVTILLLNATAPGLAAQGKGKQDAPSVTVAVTLPVEVTSRIRAFYAERPAVAVEALPPGIRKNLERGKSLPPGIAKKAVPAELRSSIELREGYELVEVGLDVLLVEIATGVIHDVLTDLIR